MRIIIISKFMNRLFLLLSFSFFLLPEAFSKANLDNDTVKVNNQVYYVIKNKRGKYVDDYGIARRTDGKVDTLFTSPMYLFGIEKQKNGIFFLRVSHILVIIMLLGIIPKGTLLFIIL